MLSSDISGRQWRCWPTHTHPVGLCCQAVCLSVHCILGSIILFADVLIAQSSARTTTSAQYLSVPCFYIYTRVIVTWWTCGCAMCACAGFEFRSARVRDHWPLGEHHYWRVRGGGGGGGEGGYEREADRMISTTTKTINRGDIQCPKSCAIHPSSSSSSNSRAVHTTTIRFTDYALVTLFLFTHSHTSKKKEKESRVIDDDDDNNNNSFNTKIGCRMRNDDCFIIRHYQVPNSNNLNWLRVNQSRPRINLILSKLYKKKGETCK